MAMKIFSITAKNLKLLMRSRTSMFVVLFGPLIIMLLVGFAFNNPSSSVINIGYHAKEKTNLTNSFLDALKSNSNFRLAEFGDSTACTHNIEQSNIHICIIFPDNFVVDNNVTNEIVFYVDQSRTNFVYSIIDTVSSKISLQSSQLSYQMTTDLLSVISNTQKSNADNNVKLADLENEFSSVSSKVDAIKDKLKVLDLSVVSINTGDMIDGTDDIRSDVNNVKIKGLDVVDAGRALITDVHTHLDSAGQNMTSQFSLDLDDHEDNINNASETAVEDIDSLVGLIDTVSTDILNVNKKLSEAKTTAGEVDATLEEIKSQMSALKGDLEALKSSIGKINSQINALRVTSAENIVNPITTRIEPITKKSNNLNFVFPYLVILIIAFISIMLSSTIIIMEKTSKAYFRNFTTPTKDIVFIMSVFLTSFIVVFLQLLLILLLAYYFLNTSISSNIILSLVLVLVSITLFTLLGMIIGYLFNSQEAVTMASISLGSVFLFLSNLILPLESMSATIQEIAKYNPYVIASELLKQLTLFGSAWKDVQTDFITLGIYVAVAFMLVVIIEKASKLKYISKKPITKQLSKKDEIIDKYFKLKSGILIRNEKELLQELKRMSDSTFQEYVTNKKNDFESWLLVIKNNDLAKRVGSSRNRKEMIDIIEKYDSEITSPVKAVNIANKK
jgi:ABC-type multidrug transport system permease subunit